MLPVFRVAFAALNLCPFQLIQVQDIENLVVTMLNARRETKAKEIKMELDGLRWAVAWVCTK